MNTKETNKNKLRMRLEKLYLAFDYIGKLGFEFLTDIFRLTTLALVIIGQIFASALLRVFVWANTSEKKVNFVSFIKRVVGIIAIVFVSAAALITTLVGGSIFGILGFRNLGEYKLKEQLAAWLIFISIVLAAPSFLSGYALYKISLAFAYTLGVIALDFLYGQCGILSLGQGTFLLLGGYITVWCNNGFFGAKVPALLSIGIAAFSMTIIGVFLGAPSLRIKDYYLTIVTLAFSLAIPPIMKSQYLANFSGVREGGISFASIKPPDLLSLMKPETLNYFIVVIPALVLIFIAYNIIHHSQIGRAFKTIRCDNEVSMIMGIPVVRYKFLAFMMCAVYAGFCGGFLTLLTKFIHPESYGFNDSVNFLVASVIGGPGSILGSFVGGTFLAYEQDLTMAIANFLPRGKDLARVSYGLILILAVVFVPMGIAGQLVSLLKSKFLPMGRRGSHQVAPPPDYDFFAQKPGLPKEKSE